MTLKTLKLLAAVGALSASVAVAQDAPKAKMPTEATATANQKLAEKVAKELAALPGTARGLGQRCSVGEVGAGEVEGGGIRQAVERVVGHVGSSRWC